jgi:tRNA A-37 threonylcarbamoyl transferase component Bud32/tetratricopeptide (TPR) repeat protein
MGALAAAEGLIGTRIGKYEIVEEVGFGGMAVVYRANDEVLKREVAVKVLHSHLSKRLEARRRFYREATAVAQLKHPNIMEIYDFSAEDSQQSYIVMEFVRGPTLRQFIEEHGAPYPEIGAMICVRLAEALAHAHEAGIIHRDVKPENVMIRGDGVIKLTDFGIAQVRDAQRMTETGSLLGSPAHMAPEVVAGEEPDERADIFSLGTVLYYAATGALPFDGRNAPSVLRAIAEGRYLDPEMRDPRIGQQLGAAIRRCLENDREARYPSMRDVATDLRACLAESGIRGIHGELRDFFAAPEVYAKAFGPRLVAALEARGREALEKREIAKAVDCFNRVLAIDDDHEGVRRLLGRLDARRRNTAYAIAIAVVLAVALVVAGVVGVFESTDPVEEVAGTPPWEVVGAGVAEGEAASELAALVRSPAEARGRLHLAVAAASVEQEASAGDAWSRAADAVRRGAVASISAVDQAAAEQLAEEEAQRIAAERERRREERAREREERERLAVAEAAAAASDAGGDRAAAVRLVDVTFNVFPATVEIRIDGDDYGTGRRNIPLTPGRHRVVYSTPTNTVEPVSLSITVPEDVDHLELPRQVLDWRPARLEIAGTVTYRVGLDGEQLGVSTGPLWVPIDAPNGRRVGSVQLIPEEGGALIICPDIEFRPGQRRRITPSDC